MDLTKALAISARGMEVQGTQLRAIAEQLAQQHDTAPGAKPAVEHAVDSTLGVETLRLQPGTQPPGDDDRLPAAPPDPFASYPGGEATMGRELQGCETNLLVMQVARSTLTRAIDMLK